MIWFISSQCAIIIYAIAVEKDAISKDITSLTAGSGKYLLLSSQPEKHSTLKWYVNVNSSLSHWQRLSHPLSNRYVVICTLKLGTLWLGFFINLMVYFTTSVQVNICWRLSKANSETRLQRLLETFVCRWQAMYLSWNSDEFSLCLWSESITVIGKPSICNSQRTD